MARDDLRSLLKAFDAIPKAARKAIRPAIDKGADEIVARAQYLAPVDDGVLKASVRKEDIGEEMAVRVTAGGEATTRDVKNPRGLTNYEFDYSLGVEYGTVDTPSQPFFWPAVNTTKKRVRRRIDRAIAKAVKEEWTK